MSDLIQSTERLEQLADYDETKKLALDAELADMAYDLAFAKAKLKAHSEGFTNPTLLNAHATADPYVVEMRQKAAIAKAIWAARQEAGRNARSALEGNRSINANQRAIV